MFSFLPPEIRDFQYAVGFRFPFERKGMDVRLDLRLSDLIAQFGLAKMNLEWIKQQRIREIAIETEETIFAYSIYNALVFEMFHCNDLYALNHGEWFVVSRDYVEEVSEVLETLESNPEIDLPLARRSETEGKYNARVAHEAPNIFALLDDRPVVYGGGRSKIEVCDLLRIDGTFVHVKSRTKSAALSHLFAQGLVSGQHMRDLRFRQKAAEKCSSEAHLSLLLSDRFQPENCTVTYAVITQAEGSLKDALPFFSKQSLTNAVNELRNIGYKVYLNKVSVEP